MRYGQINDKFYELMEQSIQECKPDDHPSKEKTLQRYGELIVAECINKCLMVSHRDDDMGAIIADNIRKYFGANNV